MNEQQIFEQAIEIADKRERTGFVRRLCQKHSIDADYLIQVTESHFESGQFMILPAAKSVEIDLPGDRGAFEYEENEWSEKVGDVIGPYTLVQEIGRGGTAIVYRASQKTPVVREVALKIIKPGLETRQVLERLRLECQALSMMNHPGIARVFDSGVTDSGRPYYAMELVDGIPITVFCENRQMSFDDRVRLFVAVCDAVGHAHRKGIIHRDLKPSNILVSEKDGEIQPIIIDFGIAKITSDDIGPTATLTRFGQIIGTPRYMSPEQASFDHSQIDTRTDVYSLGAVLYELVTGRAPFESGTLAETLRQIANDEPVAPSRINKTVNTDLETICRHCLHKSPEERYAGSGELADDLRRYLDGRPITARPVGRLLKLWKWSIRSPLSASLAALFAFAVAGLIASWIVFTWQLAAEKQLAIENFERAHQAIRKYVVTQRSHTPLGSSNELLYQKKILETGIDFYDDFLENNTRNGQLRASSRQLTDVRLERAELYAEYGKVLLSAHEDAAAVETYDTVGSICRNVLSTNPDHPTAIRTLALAHNMLAKIHLKSRQYQLAINAARQSLNCFPQPADNTSIDNSYRCWFNAISWSRIGRAHLEQNQLESAEFAFNQCLARSLQLEPVYDFQLTLCECYLDRCRLFRRKGQPRRGIEEIERALSVIRDVCTKSVPTPPRYDVAQVSCLRELATCHQELGENELALQALNRGIELQSELWSVSPGVEQFGIELVDLYRQKHALLSDPDAKTSVLESVESIRTQMDQVSRDPEQLLIKARIRSRAADNQRYRCRWDAAKQSLENALQILDQIPAEFKTATVDQLYNGLRFRLTSMNFTTCHYDKVIAHALEYQHDPGNLTSQLLSELAVAQAHRGRFEEAFAQLERIDWSLPSTDLYRSNRVLTHFLAATANHDTFDPGKFQSVVSDFKECVAQGRSTSKSRIAYDLCRAVNWINARNLDPKVTNPFVEWAKSTAISCLKSGNFDPHSYESKYVAIDPRIRCLHDIPEFRSWVKTLNSYSTTSR